MLATLTTSGSAAASTQTACGRRVRTMRSATIRCSRRFLSLRSSCSPRWSSTAGSELRRVEPARATLETPAPERRTSSSGLAPKKAASGVPQQKQKQDGNCSRRAPKTAAGSWAAAALTTTSRASTTLLISPAAIRSVAAATAASNSPGGSTLRISAGRSGAGRASAAASARRPASLAASPLDRALGAVAGRDDQVDGEEGLVAAAAERELRQDHRGRREGGPGRRCGALGVEGEAPGPDRPGPRGQARRLVEHGALVDPQALAGDVPKRASPLEVASWATPSAARAKPRSGCSQQNQRSEASREAKTAAQGSTPSTGTVTLTSVRRDRVPRQPAPSRSRAEQRLSRCLEQSRSRPCGPSRPGRGGGSSARRPRSCRPSRSPRSSSSAARRRRSSPGRSPRTG